MAEQFWNRTVVADRKAFAALLAPLIAASRCKEFDDPASARTQLHVWMISMADVPRPIVSDAVDRLLSQGVTWMPRPGDVKAVCCDIVDEHRRIATRDANALAADCVQCAGTQWVSHTDEAGVERMKRCWCFTRGMELIAEAGQPLKRPSLMAYEAETV